MTSEKTLNMSAADLRRLLDDDPAAGLGLVADLMRQRAEAATQGTWGLGFGRDIVSGIERTGRASYGCTHHIGRVLEEFERDDDTDNEADSEDDAEHIVAMANPAVALALADLLEMTVAKHQLVPDRDPSWWHEAVKVARAYLAANVEEG